MSCAACSARVEKSVSAVNGVKVCSVNLLSGTMSVDGGTEEEITAAVIKAGYGINKIGDGEAFKNEASESLAKKKLILRLSLSFGLLAVLVYISMGYAMWGLPLPSFLKNSTIAVGILELVLSAAVMIINYSFFISGAKAVIKGSPNMDTLIALGSGISFLWSVYLLIRMGVFGQDSGIKLSDFYFSAL